MRFRFLIILLMAISLSTLAACGGSSDARENRRLAEQVATLTAANDALTAEKTELQAQIETLAEQVATLTAADDALTAEKTELQAQIETLAERVAALTDTNDALASQKVELDAQVETLAEQVAVLTDTNDSLASEKAELQAQVEALTAQVATLTDTGDALASEKAELQTQAEELTGEVESLTEQRDEALARAAPSDDPEPTPEPEPMPEPEPEPVGNWQEWKGEWTDSTLNRVVGYGFLVEGESNKPYDEPVLILRCLNESPDVAIFTDEILSYEDQFIGLIRVADAPTQNIAWAVFGDYSNNLAIHNEWQIDAKFIPYILDNVEVGVQLHIAAPKDGYVASFDITGFGDVLAALPCFAQD